MNFIYFFKCGVLIFWTSGFCFRKHWIVCNYNNIYNFKNDKLFLLIYSGWRSGFLNKYTIRKHLPDVHCVYNWQQIANIKHNTKEKDDCPYAAYNNIFTYYNALSFVFYRVSSWSRLKFKVTFYKCRSHCTLFIYVLVFIVYSNDLVFKKNVSYQKIINHFIPKTHVPRSP